MSVKTFEIDLRPGALTCPLPTLDRFHNVIYSYSETLEIAGFVATEMVKQLLEKGYNVVGTVRSASNPRADTLKALAKALPGQLELIEADLLESGAFDEAVQGCTFIFHMA